MIVSVLLDGHNAIHILLLELAMAKYKYVLKFLVIILHSSKNLEIFFVASSWSTFDTMLSTWECICIKATL